MAVNIKDSLKKLIKISMVLLIYTMVFIFSLNVLDF